MENENNNAVFEEVKDMESVDTETCSESEVNEATNTDEISDGGHAVRNLVLGTLGLATGWMAAKKIKQYRDAKKKDQKAEEIVADKPAGTVRKLSVKERLTGKIEVPFTVVNSEEITEK